MNITKYQEDLVNKLLKGNLTTKQLGAMRSNSRRTGNLERSISLAVVFEIYKFKVKSGKEREKKGV